jgi:hypothetical protein
MNWNNASDDTAIRLKMSTYRESPRALLTENGRALTWYGWTVLRGEPGLNRPASRAAATHEHSLAPHQVEFGHSLALHHVEFGHRRQHHLCRCDCRVGFSGRVTVESLYALGQIEFVLMVGVASGVSLRPRADRVRPDGGRREWSLFTPSGRSSSS